MSQDTISTAQQVTPEWLTSALQRTGALPRGRAVGVAPGEPTKTFASQTWRLHVTYSGDAPAEAPTRLFLKSSSPELAPGESRPDWIDKEVVFYRVVAAAMDDAPSAPCYDAGFDPDTGASHLLLLDLSDTHETCGDPLHERNAERAVERLACLHAFWWDHPRLGEDVGSFPTYEVRQQRWADADEAVSGFIAELGDQLPEEWRLAYSRVAGSLPHLGQRQMQGLNMTLIHGDAHLGNFLFPREASGGVTHLIDWQFWNPNIGSTDLAFMIATDWEPSVRRKLEHPLIRRYHHTLLKHGVQGYDWDSCWNDYRLSVALVSIFIPVWRWSIFGWEADINTVEKGMTAFEELECAELLPAE
jgi:thiamine kinase-like enzyme